MRSRASLYQALERLMRLGLVEVRETVRSEGYPDRVVYGITEAGRETAEEWLREMLRTTGNEYPEFIAAVSVLFGLAPDDVRTQLAQRAERLAAELAQTEAIFTENPDLPRLFLLEEEYRRAVLAAELDWVRVRRLGSRRREAHVDRGVAPGARGRAFDPLKDTEAQQ